MDYTRKVKNASELFSVRGNFDLPQGEIEKCGNELVFSGEDIEFRSAFEAHPSGVTKRRDTIKNISQKDISINTLLSRFVFNGGEYQVYTQYSVWCGERYGAWQPLVSEIGAESFEVRTNLGSAPFVAIYNEQTGRGMAFHIMCDSLWRFKVKNFYTQTGQEKRVMVELGMSSADLDLRIAQGESFELPEILYYEFKNKTDIDAYKLHRYCNEVYRQSRLPVIYNTWLSNFDDIGFDFLCRQLDISKRIGVEYFVVDAGWFGAPRCWSGSVGDWRESEESAMGGRMAELADRVRDAGLRFGLWFEVERASTESEAYLKHPERYIVEGKDAFLNFADDDACNAIIDTVSEQVEKYGIEFIKFDFNAPLTYDKDRSAFVGYFKGWRKFLKSLAERFPTLCFECCASGGLRMTLSNIGSFDSFWMSDDHSLYNQLEIFKNTVLRMPPRALEKWITVRSLEGFTPVYKGGVTEKILMSGDAAWGHIEGINADFMKVAALGGPIGISCDLTSLSEGLVDTLAQFIAEFKAERDFWLSAECHILCNTDTLTILQYNDREFNKIKIFTFAKLPTQNYVTVYPCIEGEGEYQCSNGEEYTAAELDDDGIEVYVKTRFTANSVTLVRK